MIRNYHIIRSILSEPWLISAEEVSRLGFLISGVFNRQLAFEPVTREDMAQVAYVRSAGVDPSGKVRNVGVVNITGVLTKYDPECAYGMESYGRMIRISRPSCCGSILPAARWPASKSCITTSSRFRNLP